MSTRISPGELYRLVLGEAAYKKGGVEVGGLEIRPEYLLARLTKCQ